DGRTGFLEAVESAVKLFFGIGGIGRGIGGVLPPAPPHDENEDVAGIDVLVDDALRASADRGESVFPTERDELNIRAAAEAFVEFIDLVLERPAFDCEIAGGGDEYFDLAGGH